MSGERNSFDNFEELYTNCYWLVYRYVRHMVEKDLALVPSGQCGRTFSPSVLVPFSRISRHILIKISSAMLICLSLIPPDFNSIYRKAN